ncbi:MAG: Nre family DNA repair protein [Candidatus Aenigmatarchaeota archaeon]
MIMPKYGRHLVFPARKNSLAGFVPVKNNIRKFTQQMQDSANCYMCKTMKKISGVEMCPRHLKEYHYFKTKPMINSLSLEGSSPPGIFVGRAGYPKVFVGPLIPPVHGDTLMMDTPEMWNNLPIDNIVSFRSQLVRGMKAVDITDNESRFACIIKELALAKDSAEVEANFSKMPRGGSMSEDSQPFGPSAPIKDIFVGSMKTEQSIDKAYSDTDLLSSDAIMDLYRKGIFISKIQRSFSAGLFGLGKRRKLVPTRWSITAVDSTLSKIISENLKMHPSIDEFRVYYYEALDNRWAVLMMPYEWSYELIEAWYPSTLWNPASQIVIMSDHEGNEGKKEYSRIGGCFYSARLAVSEHLEKEHRQAATVIMRETHPGYILPLGVWVTRNAVRECLTKEPAKFDNLVAALDHISTKLAIKTDRWIQNSAILRNTMYQKKLGSFVQK